MDKQLKPRTAREQEIASYYKSQLELKNIQLTGCREVFLALVDEMDLLDRAGVVNANQWRKQLKKAAEALKDV